MGLTYGYVLGAALHVAGVALAACIAGDSDGARSDGKDEGECTNEHNDAGMLNGNCEDGDALRSEGQNLASERGFIRSAGSGTIRRPDPTSTTAFWFGFFFRVLREVEGYHSRRI